MAADVLKNYKALNLNLSVSVFICIKISYDVISA